MNKDSEHQMTEGTFHIYIQLTSIPVNKKIQTLKLIITKLSTLQPFRLFIKFP